MVSVRHFCWCQYLVLCPARLAPPPSPTRPSCSLAHCSDFPEQRQPWCLLPTPDGQSVWSSFRPVPWVTGGSAPAGCITQDPLCWPWDFSSDKLEEEAYPLPGEEAGDMPPSGLQLVLLRGSHLLLLCSVQPRGLISVPPLVSWQLLCSFAHVELGPSGSPLDLEWIHSACVDPSS